MMIGADYYQTEAEIKALLVAGNFPIGIGKDTKIMNCIIDKNARIGTNVIIANEEIYEQNFHSNEILEKMLNKQDSNPTQQDSIAQTSSNMGESNSTLWKQFGKVPAEEQGPNGS
ncbi:unnamed protein product [Lupinus luteus]|uniref:Uncharacterized protein n=1 Tax=Lupinus luteus TaxID=3873 RepID=A0AAV1Y3B1_LUPLU